MHAPVSGSPLTPGSPLTYSPQIAMEPLSKGDEYQRAGSVYGQSEFAGWAAQPKLVPTVLVCECAAGRGGGPQQVPLRLAKQGRRPSGAAAPGAAAPTHPGCTPTAAPLRLQGRTVGRT